MCKIFISADPELYRCRSRSLRLSGVATSIRLENQFWQVLEEIGRRDSLSIAQLISRLYDELADSGGDCTTSVHSCASVACAIWRCKCPAVFLPTPGYQYVRLMQTGFLPVKNYPDPRKRRQGISFHSDA